MSVVADKIAYTASGFLQPQKFTQLSSSQIKARDIFMFKFNNILQSTEACYFSGLPFLWSGSKAGVEEKHFREPTTRDEGTGRAPVNTSDGDVGVVTTGAISSDFDNWATLERIWSIYANSLDYFLPEPEDFYGIRRGWRPCQHDTISVLGHHPEITVPGYEGDLGARVSLLAPGFGQL